MDPIQEIVETVREIRKGQIEALEWRRRYMRKMRIFFIILGILLVAYVVWAIFLLR